MGAGADLVFCCFGGGALSFFETRLFLVLAPAEAEPFEPLPLLLPLSRLSLFRTVLVGAMSSGECRQQEPKYVVDEIGVWIFRKVKAIKVRY